MDDSSFINIEPPDCLGCRDDQRRERFHQRIMAALDHVLGDEFSIYDQETGPMSRPVYKVCYEQTWNCMDMSVADFFKKSKTKPEPYELRIFKAGENFTACLVALSRRRGDIDWVLTRGSPCDEVIAAMSNLWDFIMLGKSATPGGVYDVSANTVPGDHSCHLGEGESSKGPLRVVNPSDPEIEHHEPVTIPDQPNNPQGISRMLDRLIPPVDKSKSAASSSAGTNSPAPASPSNPSGNAMFDAEPDQKNAKAPNVTKPNPGSVIADTLTDTFSSMIAAGKGFDELWGNAAAGDKLTPETIAEAVDRVRKKAGKENKRKVGQSRKASFTTLPSSSGKAAAATEPFNHGLLTVKQGNEGLSSSSAASSTASSAPPVSPANSTGNAMFDAEPAPDTPPVSASAAEGAAAVAPRSPGLDLEALSLEPCSSADGAE